MHDSQYSKFPPHLNVIQDRRQTVNPQEEKAQTGNLRVPLQHQFHVYHQKYSDNYKFYQFKQNAKYKTKNVICITMCLSIMTSSYFYIPDMISLKKKLLQNNLENIFICSSLLKIKQLLKPRAKSYFATSIDIHLN